MILSPQSINRHRLGSSSDILAAQLLSLPPINLTCTSHKQQAHHICLQENCSIRLLCSQCASDHPEAHKSGLLPCHEVLGNEIIKRIDQEILCNILIEQKNEIYVKFLDQVQVALVEIRKRIDKTLTSIYNTVKEKSLSNCAETLYPTNEWDKLKKSLYEKKISLAKANPEGQRKPFEDYLKVYSIANITLMDAENTKDLKNTIDSKECTNSPELDPQSIDETIKSLRGILTSFCTKLSLQVSPLFTPEENIQHSPSPYYKKFSLSATSSGPPSPYFGRSQKHKLSQFVEPSSGSSIPLVKELSQVRDNKFLEKMPSTSAGGGDNVRNTPDEILSPTRPPFLYDEYLATEVINLPYVGPIKLDDGTVFRGQMKEGKKHGKGKLVWKDGKFYEGYFKEDQIEGKGRMVHADQDIYEGEWKNGKAHGKGKYEKADGWVYEGEWANDEPHGKGIELWPDRSSYDGEYQNGSKNGKGTLIGPDGSCYCGSFKENLFHGEGKYIWIDGRKYEGSWVENKRDGKGVMYYPDGKKYNGEFANEKKHGFGRFDWGDGRKYVGYWNAGKQHGQGKLYTKSGDIVDGEWKEGKLVENIAAAINEAKSIKNLELAKEKVELTLKRVRSTSRNHMENLLPKEINPLLLSPPIGSKELQDSFRQKIREPEEKPKPNKEKAGLARGITLMKKENSRERRSSIEANM